ncbi:histidine phosphatase family protein [Alloscardovia theropitheci]|uniref:Histidine phosphatase family protein n=2 Tax=Alloscardovia theropitheci TaxID=2496842 RepID=A0A4V2MTZ2_9BIFI|nr:histidine phosphatase family protein [Alloscardovia theropitheci]
MSKSPEPRNSTTNSEETQWLVEQPAQNTQNTQKAQNSQYTTVHLVRHGEVFNPDHVLYERLPGFHLSERGFRMAHETGRYMARNKSMKNPAAVFSSPLDRTIDTATAIIEEITRKSNSDTSTEHDSTNLAIKTDERIIEARNEFRGKRIGHGEGALWKNGNWRLVLNLWRPSWGESYKEIAARVQDFVFEKVDEFAGKSIIVVSHESPIWSFRHMLETGHPEHNMLLRKTALASVTSFTFEVGTHKLVSIEYADPAANVE